MPEGYARVSGHVSASSPEKLPLKRNAGIDDCQAGAFEAVDQKKKKIRELENAGRGTRNRTRRGDP